MYARSYGYYSQFLGIFDRFNFQKDAINLGLIIRKEIVLA